MDEDFGLGANRPPRLLRRQAQAEIWVIGGWSRVGAPGFALDAKRDEFLPTGR